MWPDRSSERYIHLRCGWISASLIFLLAACAGPAWKADPDVQAVMRVCASPEVADQYACLEREAVTRLSPEVCRLAGIWIDDMCLQAVYEAADDPAICDRIYLRGVVPTCKAYYAGRAEKYPTAAP